MQVQQSLDCLIGLLISYGSKLLQVAIFVPFFLTTESFDTENVFVVITCLNVLLYRLLKMGLYITRMTQAHVTITRLVVSEDGNKTRVFLGLCRSQGYKML